MSGRIMVRIVIAVGLIGMVACKLKSPEPTKDPRTRVLLIGDAKLEHVGENGERRLIRPLKSGEWLTLVEPIASVGGHGDIAIENLTVKTSHSQVGYVEPEFALRVTPDEERVYRKHDIRGLSGWLRPPKGAAFTIAFPGTSSPASDNKQEPAPGATPQSYQGWLRVFARNFSGEKYYLVARDRYSVRFWVSAKGAEYQSDLLEATLKSAPDSLPADIREKLLRETNRAIGGNLNAGKVELRTIPALKRTSESADDAGDSAHSEPPPERLLVTAYRYTARDEEPFYVLFLRQGERLQCLGSLAALPRYVSYHSEATLFGGVEARLESKPEFRDLDGDGRLEMILRDSDRGGPGLSIYMIEEGQTRHLFSAGGGDMAVENGESSYVGLRDFYLILPNHPRMTFDLGEKKNWKRPPLVKGKRQVLILEKGAYRLLRPDEKPPFDPNKVKLEPESSM